MGEHSVVKMGRSLVRSIVNKSKKVVKKSIGKVFESGALMDRLLDRSTALLLLDDRFSSACRSILLHRSKCSSQKPHHKEEDMVSSKEELRVEVVSNEEVLIPPVPERRLSSIEIDASSSTSAELVPACTLEASKEEEDDEGVCKEGGDYYSSFSEEEFREMVEGFIQRFNEQISQEYYSANDCHEIEFVKSPLQRSAYRVY